jgi:hypothetical protein
LIYYILTLYDINIIVPQSFRYGISVAHSRVSNFNFDVGGGLTKYNNVDNVSFRELFA